MRRYAVSFRNGADVTVTVLLSSTGPMAAAMEVASLYPSGRRFKVRSEPSDGPAVQFLEDPESQGVMA